MMKNRSDPSTFNPEKFLEKDSAKNLAPGIHFGKLTFDVLMPISWSKKHKEDFIARLEKSTPAALYLGADTLKLKSALQALESEVASELKNLGLTEDPLLVRMLAWGCVVDPLYQRAVRRAKSTA
jgi:hypothetical protein